MKRILFLLIFLLFCGVVFSQKTTSITGNPNPVIYAGPDLILASGQNQVQVQATVDDATASILWSGPYAFGSTELRPWISNLGQYTVEATNHFGCSASDQMILREAQLGDTLIIQIPIKCVGEEPIWLHNYTSHATEGHFTGTYVVDDSLYFDKAGEYQIIWYFDGKEFTSSYTVLGSPNVNIPNDTIFRCQGQNAILYAQGNATNWVWSTLTNPNDVLSNESVYQVSVNEPMYYLLTGSLVYNTEQKTCSAKDSVFVSTISARFTYEQLVEEMEYGMAYGSNVTYRPDYKDAYSYNWDLGISGVTSTETNPFHNYGDNVGTFVVTLNMVSMCGNSSHTERVYINYKTSVDDLLKTGDVKLYPNPVSGDWITLDFGDKRVSKIEVWDMVGRQLFVDRFNTLEKIQIDVSSYKAGFYLIKLSGNEGGNVSLKFIKQ